MSAPPVLSPAAGLRLGASVAALCLLLVLVACGGSDGGAPEGIQVTQGAAPGYVDDQTCARCHADLYGSFQEVGMGRSFYRPREDRMVEDFSGEPFHHEESDRYYRMTRDGERIFFERYQLDAEGKPIHRYEVEVDWVLGSGHTSRTYLFQTPSGEVFQLPIAWYSQSDAWEMAPGFDHPTHFGVERRVRRECMFCHNGYPEVPEGADAHGMPQIFPTELPEGIGCQRCHGPGAEHVFAAMKGDRGAALASIVEPGKLEPLRTMDLCYSCHFQPSVALSGVRRYGRGVFSHRPNEPLTDYLAMLDVEELGESREDRFEINHHPYRLEQSTCFEEAAPGTLTCLTCHDPHRKVPAADRKVHYRNACLSCHQLDACALDEMQDRSSLAAAGLGEVASDDCATCHMPRRRTQDVVQVVMTDHRIQRWHGGPELVAPLPETVPILRDASILRPLGHDDPRLDQIYRASAVTRAGGNQDATRFLADTLPGMELDRPEPHIDLIQGLLTQRRTAEAEAMASRVLQTWPELDRVREWRGVARVRLGRAQEALADFEAVLASSGQRPEPLFNRGLALLVLNRFEEAETSLRGAVELRPNLPRAWYYLGRTLVALERREEAVEALQRSLSINPTAGRVSAELGLLLAGLERRDEALRVLRHGAVHSAVEVELVTAALAQVEAQSRGSSAGP